MKTSPPLPAFFIGHGSPMNAIEDSEFSKAWTTAGQSIEKPQAILAISAHWQTEGTRVTAAKNPETIHDFGGFPRALHEMTYPAPGSPELAQKIARMMRRTRVTLDPDRGLDHGVWSILARMFPEADVPVVQLSLDMSKPAEFHYELGKELRPLRSEGVLIVGSGNVAHNLGRMVWQDVAFDWAVEFDRKMKEFIEKRDHRSVIHYEGLGEPARLSVPDKDHFFPLLYILALQNPDEPVTFFSEKVSLGSMSMRSLRIG